MEQRHVVGKIKKALYEKKFSVGQFFSKTIV